MTIPNKVVTRSPRKFALALVAVLSALAMFLSGCGHGDDSAQIDQSQGQQHLPEFQPGVGKDGAPKAISINGDKTKVLPIGLREGSLAPPDDDIHSVAWYQDSAVPGSGDEGTVVMTGHVDFNGESGYASNFSRLKKGDVVTVEGESGKVFRYRVTSSPQMVPKSNPVKFNELGDKTFNRFDGPGELVLITCGGRFIGGSLGYESNEVVTAEPMKN